ncbi:MAG: polyprenyl synthetase family protein [Moraxellaceae bacterium]|nr:polyprenyl synthetase family protein [Pseudobdellovibrionaceae bacterium]
MIAGLETDYTNFRKYFEDESTKYFHQQSEINPQLELLWKSMAYTYFLDGKRFRPFLCYLTAQAFKKPFSEVFPWALAVELIHTYSLIHDDLPCLDNDDLRRGQPTNHKVFGEDVALLSGDALLSEAFSVVANMAGNPQAIIQVIQLLSNKIGAHGMVGGQVLDMKVDPKISLKELEYIHLLKTANLIEVSVFGAAVLCGAGESQISQLSLFASQLGIAFQIKDDLLDGLDSDQDFKNYIKILGEEKTVVELKNKTEVAREALKKAQVPEVSFEKLLEYNINRTQ